jgi:phosphohistidine phosphatase
VFGLEDVRVPDLVMCSAAIRTRQTADLVVRELDGQLPIDSYQSLYGAETDTVLQYLREVDDGVKSVMLVGHNPTIFRMAWELLAEDADPMPDSDEGSDPEFAPDEGVDRLALRRHGFPTCALAVLTLGLVSWEDTAPGCGRLSGVFSPPY